MFLKKIRVVGFKSFANLVEIKLTEGITTIVGPNGSGKSNITDAVKWVLGEQSIKALRGKTRDDVIFSGTINKKPLGFAEVSLHFDNRTKYFAAEHEEIIVKRRLFRSGESEYYLNDNQCRLKDIQNIFMDTGLGKNGYSIISQGKMDTIINNDANELRQIIEEAVGVVKYKTRKNEAIRRLDKANNNIERAQDIIS
jgi:chromosome segregation protein